ncbi:twin-arginine translocase TatA/TatE family subunit [Methylocapsa acidiphila]|uniref:twin-arginine translocase TatA/TatE family subunit n=1 Tax=Methylocapsa acidiphila TaxID=133552 RepID=UPI000421BC0F|nr:twin-arginine translocase TatA/TatE family subunit [Methylocapsa acidiphila]
MFEFDAGKLIIIGIVALIVIGPKELPGVLRQLGQAVGKMRRMAAEFQGQFMEAMREADMADIKADVDKLANSAKLDVGFNPIAEIESQVRGAVDAAGKPPSEAIDALALAAPHAAESSLNSIEIPRLPEAAPEGGDSLLAAWIAPAPVEGEAAAASSKAPVAGVEAEMQALAHALEAEMRGQEAAVGVATPAGEARNPA